MILRRFGFLLEGPVGVVGLIVADHSPDQRAGFIGPFILHHTCYRSSGQLAELTPNELQIGRIDLAPFGFRIQMHSGTDNLRVTHQVSVDSERRLIAAAGEFVDKLVRDQYQST